MRKHFTAAAVTCAAAVLIVTSYAQDTVDVSTLPFSPAREAGTTLYLSGQIAVAPDGTAFVGRPIADQTHQTMRNLEAILHDNGYDWGDVMKVTVYLSDMKHYAEMNAAYRTYFDGEFPARECVGGLQLAFGLDTEISCIAYKEQ